MRRRRDFLQRFGAAGMQLAAGWGCSGPPPAARTAKLFLAGDVMTGRGIDQILPHPSRPHIYEGYVKSALDYVAFAEARGGPIPRGVAPAYIWGDALEALDRLRPDVRIINLETSITASEEAEPKGINYRMHPANVACLSAARIDCCVLANNHVLDWGRPGLEETLHVLRDAGMRTAGAGADHAEAHRPAVMDAAGGRVLLFAVGGPDCGIPPEWAAGEGRSGVAFLSDYSVRTAEALAARIRAGKQPGDIVILSIHWGPNWGYGIPPEYQAFARHLIDAGAADLIYGHSSHHAKGIELYRNKLIFYGCGDFLNDYEGIEGYENFRGDLAVMYLPELVVPSGELAGLGLRAFQMRRFRLQHAARSDAQWLRGMLNREGRRLGTNFKLQADGGLRLA